MSVEFQSAFEVSNRMYILCPCMVYFYLQNLAENRLGRDGAEELCDMLYKNEFLLSLNLSGKPIPTVLPAKSDSDITFC